MTAADVASVLVHSQATGSAKLVLMGIAFHTGNDKAKGCWPSCNLLAAYANISVRQVYRSLDYLVEIGELVVESRASWKRGSGDLTNLYFMTELCSQSCQVHRHEMVTSMTHGSDIHDVNGDMYDVR